MQRTGRGGGIRAWTHLAILDLCGTDGLLDVEDVTAEPIQKGSACVQYGLTAPVTGHHHAIDGDTAEGDRMALRHSSTWLFLPGALQTHPCQDPQAPF